MNKYTIKQPVFKLYADTKDFKRWYADNIETTLEICYESTELPPYFAQYCFEEYYEEDSSRFETFELAKEWLIAEFNSYVSRNLNEVQEMTKQLTQAVFNLPDCPPWAKSAAVDENGYAHYFSVYKKFMTTGTILGHKCWVFDSDKFDHTCSACRFERIKGKYDTSSWKHSAIDRE